MNLYLASVHMPGYLPVDDERHIFHGASDAWAWLADERRRDEDQDDESPEYSDVVRILDHIASGEHVHGARTEDHPTEHDGTGAVHGGTPGYEGDHDLGLMYTVSLWRHQGYPHAEGHLYDCEPCEYTCHGDRGSPCAPGDTSCVHCHLVTGEEMSCEDTECNAVHLIQRRVAR